MRRGTWLVAVASVAFGLGMVGVNPGAGQPAPPAAKTEPEPVVGQRPADPGELQQFSDPAFDRYADLDLAGKALLARDAAMLTDCALQLAEGERVLMRSHRSKVTAKALLDRAVTLAAETQDNAVLERLTRVAERLQDKDFSAAVSSASKVAGVSRVPAQALTVDLATLKIEDVLTFMEVLDEIRTGATVADKKRLEATALRLKESASLTDEQRRFLDAELAAAGKRIETRRTPEDETLVKLAAGSRDSWLHRFTGSRLMDQRNFIQPSLPGAITGGNTPAIGAGPFNQGRTPNTGSGGYPPASAGTLVLPSGGGPLPTYPPIRPGSLGAGSIRQDPARPGSLVLPYGLTSPSRGGEDAGVPLADRIESRLPAELRDPAFDAAVDLTEVGNALTRRDPALLADVVLQLANAERLLLRPRRTPLTAKALFEKATQLAADLRDKATLDRLAKAADRMNDSELAALVGNAQKLAGAERTADPGRMLVIEKLDAGTLALLKGLYDEVAAAQFTADKEALGRLEKRLDTIPRLPDESVLALRKAIKAALEGPAKPQGTVEAALQKLTAASRSPRITWVYTNVDGRGVFHNPTGRIWVEDTPTGARFTFREVTRNADFIEIYDASRQCGVRLYENSSLWKQPEMTGGEWLPLWEGAWQE